MLSLLFLPPRGLNSIANFDGGAMAGFAPSGSATDARAYKTSVLF